MDIFLSKVTQQAMNYAIRSGVTITASYAIRQSSRLLKSVPKSDERDELQALQERLHSKIRIISPAIDMIELIAARGNTSLESAVSLTKTLRQDIQSLGQRLANAAIAEEAAKRQRSTTKPSGQGESEIKLIITDVKKLLGRIEDAIPLINLAITTSGANLSTTLPSTVSPSRLLQASTFLTAGDTQYSFSPDQAVQVGPTFTLSVYMLFAGNVRPQDEEGIRETTWKEVMHKARVKLRRVPIDVPSASENKESSTSDQPTPSNEDPSNNHMPGPGRADEFSYQLMLIEDLDDDRVHDFDDGKAQPGPFDDVELAGIREIVPVYQVSKIFYADTGKVLNIGSEGEASNPVLLLKRDIHATPPRRMLQKDVDPYDEGEIADENDTSAPPNKDMQQPNHDPHSYSGLGRLPPGLDPEWLAFEVYAESSDESDDDESSNPDPSSPSPAPAQNSNSAVDANLTSSLSNLKFSGAAQTTNSTPSKSHTTLAPPFSSTTQPPPPWANQIRTSLSLLELLLRLTSLQQFQQQSHLSITDELLNFFLEESATTGAGGDENYRQRLRTDARRRVGWDPYDESPVKRRGEEYQYQQAYHEGGTYSSPRWDDDRREQRDYFLRFSREGTPAGESPTNFQRQQRQPPLPPDARTRSMTGVSDTETPEKGSRQSPNLPYPSGSGNKGKSSAYPRGLREAEGMGRKGSPLRPGTGVSDEGIGTSPGTSRLEEGRED
ncbi:MAG: hypothetical protein Q9227_004987 [Pyrenula ochraceoflavens]